MHVFWGCLMAAIGLCLFLCARFKSEFVVYRLLVARSKILWGEKAYLFHQVSGIAVIVFGALLALGYIPMK